MDGKVEHRVLVENEELPDAESSRTTTPSATNSTSGIPVVYYTADGGRIAREQTVVASGEEGVTITTPETTTADRGVINLSHGELRNLIILAAISFVVFLPVGAIALWLAVTARWEYDADHLVEARRRFKWGFRTSCIACGLGAATFMLGVSIYQWNVYWGSHHGV